MQEEKIITRDESAQFYSGFKNQEELDLEYNVEKAVPNFAAYINYYQQASALARSYVRGRMTFEYGPTRMEKLTVYPGEQPDAPVLVFVHGGYWRMGMADDFDFIVKGPLELGFTVVNVNYALAPQVSIPEIVRQVRSAIAWTAKNISSHGGDANNIFLAGHSAGAHLVAMADSTNWEDYGLRKDIIKGILAISGLYDLQPVSQSFIQPAVRITADQILSSSPIRLIKPSETPMTISWGALETHAFRKQSDEYLNSWRMAGNLGLSVIIEGADHFNILKEFEYEGGLLSQALLALYQNNK